MLFLLAEIALRSTWWILYGVYWGMVYLVYGKQETLEDKLKKKVEIDNKNMNELKKEIEILKNKINELEDIKNKNI